MFVQVLSKERAGVAQEAPSLAARNPEIVTHELATRTDMQASSLEDLTRHYVETLRCRRANVRASDGRIGPHDLAASA